MPTEVEPQPETLPGLQPAPQPEPVPEPEATLREQPGQLANRLRVLYQAARKQKLDVDALVKEEFHVDLLSLTVSEYQRLLHAIRQVGNRENWVNAWRDPYADRNDYMAEAMAYYPEPKQHRATTTTEAVLKVLHTLQADSGQ